MKSDYIQALKGTLASPKDRTATPKFTPRIDNAFDIPVSVVWLTAEGYQDVSTMKTIAPGCGVSMRAGKDDVHLAGDCFLVTSRDTGGFMCAVKLAAMNAKEHPKNVYIVGPHDLVQPGDIGPLPEPTPDQPIPNDSPRVVVGASSFKKPADDTHGKTHYHHFRIVREQFWHRGANSYSLAPDEERTVNLTTTSGRQQMSSEETTVQKSLDLGVAVGWGPISASISSSLSSTTTGFQQMTISEQSTAYVSTVLKNHTTETRTVLYWQLIDIVTVFDFDGKAVSSVSQAANPTLVKSYPPSDKALASGRPPQTLPPLYPQRLLRARMG